MLQKKIEEKEKEAGYRIGQRKVHQKKRPSDWQKKMTGIRFMHYHIFVRNMKERTVPKRPPLLLKSYLRKRLMKLENTMTIDKE
jgi:hypothetical protein